jgi:hypothetical protein
MQRVRRLLSLLRLNRLPWPSVPPPVQAPHACRNCGAELAQPVPRFCGQCGQETAVQPPTVAEFLHQFGGNYVATEGALWRTLGLLLLRPGWLTREYLSGRRRRYVLPLRLYLTISLIALLALRWSSLGHVADGHTEWIKVDPSDPQDATLVDVDGVRLGLLQGVFVCEGLPASWCQHLRERLTLDPQSLQREMRKVPERFLSHWGSAMFALLPVFALLHKLVYWRRGMRWSEHLVFALHVHAFWFAMLLCTVAGQKGLSDLAMLAMPVYALMAARTVYGGGWWATIWRAAVVALAYLLVMALAMVLVGIWAFLA